MTGVRKKKRIIKFAAFGPFAERIEYYRARSRQRPDLLQQAAERDSAPLRDSRPTLNTMMQSNLALPAQSDQLVEREFARFLDHTKDFKPVVLELTGGQLPPFFAGR